MLSMLVTKFDLNEKENSLKMFLCKFLYTIFYYINIVIINIALNIFYLLYF